MKLLYAPKARKQILKFDSIQALKISRKLKILESDPFIGKALTGKFNGFYSLRAWPYRIVYTVFIKENTILVTTIEHRQGVYT